jgi:predicted transcriptional regulator
VRLSRAGYTDREISNIVGMSVLMVSRYTHLSTQKDNDVAAVIRLQGTPLEHVTKKSTENGS